MNSKVAVGLLGAAAIGAAVGAYYYTQRKEEVKIEYNPAVHTKEELKKVLQTFEIEYASMYLHWYTMLKTKAKEIGKENIPEYELEAFEEKMREITESIDEEVYAEHKISRTFFQEWIKRFENDREITAFVQRLEANFDKLLNIEKPIFDLAYPKEITKEKYIKYISLAYAKFRYDVYQEIQSFTRSRAQKTIDEDEFNE